MKIDNPLDVFTLLRETTAAPAAASDTLGLRVLFVYAHPDDEMIAVGGHLPLLRDALFLQVTDGAPADNADGDRLGLPRDAYRATRSLEVRAAFAAAGLPEARHRCLNFTDKEAALHLPELTRAVAAVMQQERPDVIFTHPYEGGHADHDACAFAVHIAASMALRLGRAQPLIVESPFYFAEEDGSMCTGRFLHEQPRETDCELPLTDEQQRRKRSAFKAFATQASVLAAFTPAVQCERFRVAPAYNFTETACAGRAFYESFIPGITAQSFAASAAQAQTELMQQPVAA